jgi:hypothetical protein
MRPDQDWRPGPDVPRAHHFDAAFCDDANCGLHLIPMFESGEPICEIVMSAEQTRILIEKCKGWLYEKAVRREQQ